MGKTNTSILFSGKSEYTGKPVQALITRTSSNTKTGNIPQITFLPKNVKPTDALKSGRDQDVCGSCPLRPSKFNPKTHDKPCYVNCGFAPNAIARRKTTPDFDYSEVFPVLRLGAWGDSASIERQALLKIVDLGKRVLNYTHAWSFKKFNFLKAFSMASVHSVAEKNQANKLGFRAFRTVKPLLFADHLKLFKNGQHTVSDLQSDEILCPNFTKSIQCKNCKLCCGNQIKTKLNIVIPSH